MIISSPAIALDSATLYGVMHAATYRKVEEWPDWTARCVISATSLFLRRQKILIPPAPKQPQYSGLSSLLFGELNGSIADPQAPINTKKIIIDKTNSSVKNDKVEWAKRFKNLVEDDSCDPWLDRAISHFWEELTILHDGVFDYSFIPSISVLLDVPESQLIELHRISQNSKTVKQWSKQRKGEDFELTSKAYLATNFLRGYYYNDILSEMNNSRDHQQVHSIFHPLREYSLPAQSFQGFGLENTNTEVGLICLLSSSLLIDKKPEERLKRWTHNLRGARNAIYRHDLGLNHCRNSDAVMDHVMQIVKRGDLDFLSTGMKKISQLTTEFLTATTGYGIGVFFAGPIEGAIGAGGGLVVDKLGQGLREKTLKNVARRKSRIRKLWDDIENLPACRIVLPRKD